MKKATRKTHFDYVLRSFVIFFFPMIIAFLSYYFFASRNLINAFLVWGFWPISTFFLWGSLKKRLMNTLPLIISLLYFILSIQLNDFQGTLVIFYIVPFLSLLVKPKKHFFQYLTLLISAVFLTLEYFFQISVNSIFKCIFIMLVYILFIPPFIKEKTQSLVRKNAKKINRMESINEKSI